MKKYLIIVSVLLMVFFLANQAYYYLGYYIDLQPNQPVTTFMKTDSTTIYIKTGQEYKPFEIRGVDMGVGIPGKWATDFAVTEEMYLRWFTYIQEMGANTIRVYTILHEDFYNAFYKYNLNNEKPLYLLHGLWVKDYNLNSHIDAFSPVFREKLLDDSKTLVDVLHGEKSVSSGGEFGSGIYRSNISAWVIGYILGVEWEPSVVTYTNQTRTEQNQYSGKYLYTKAETSPFEVLLCEVGDKLIQYESDRYKQQRLLAFSNWPTTDPFVYPPVIALYRDKMTSFNVENILSTPAFLSGQFASYHVYTYFPDYLGVLLETQYLSETELVERLEVMRYRNTEYRLSKLTGPRFIDYFRPEDIYDDEGKVNTYLAYLRVLNRYHTMPVVISEYGVTTGRGRAQIDRNTGRHQGFMTEAEQGQALIDSYQDIKTAGSAGSCVFTWQDEWFKRTWNTMYAVDLDKTPYWSDAQTNEQYFGLLAFDPGKETSVVYVDGNIEEWQPEDLVTDEEGMQIYCRYDEKYLYFLVQKTDWQQQTVPLFIPFDITPKSGSTYCIENQVAFERPADFLLTINGESDSRLLVQERYDTLRAIYGVQYYGKDFYANPPLKDDPHFTEKLLPLTLNSAVPPTDRTQPSGQTFDTGQLTYGNGNPQSPNFNSLADFHFTENGVEIRLPWQLLNFSNPSEMQVHDDYYPNYGIENLSIKEIYIGAALQGDSGHRIRMYAIPLEPWNHKVTFHERLKQSYYMVKDYWTKNTLP